jgi:hypothetical protein
MSERARAKLLRGVPSEAEAEALLPAARERLAAALQATVPITLAEDILYLVPHYGDIHGFDSGEIMRRVEPGASYAGQLAGVFGQLLLLHCEPAGIVLDARALRGRMVHLGDAPVLRRGAHQTRLF